MIHIFFFHYRGWQGLIAQGCHSSILIIDPKTAQTIQVLEKHKANVVKVSFHLFTNLHIYGIFILNLSLH